jgi:hydroxymethylbilane synthase
VLPIEDMLPAGGQGIIGATLRKDAPDWLKELLAKIDNEEARLAAIAERAFLRRLDGSCRTPIAAHFRLTEDGAEMAGEVLSDDGAKRWRAEGVIEGRPTVFDAEVLGDALAEDVAIERSYDLGGVLPPDYAPDSEDEDGA